MLVELIEKFQESKIAADASDRYLADLITLGEFVFVAPDPHFDVLDGAYQGIPILDGLHFLYVVRGDRPPELIA